VDVRGLLSELVYFSGRGVCGHGDVPGRVQINADPPLDLAQRRLIDGNRDERELVVQLDLIDLLKWRKVTEVQAELEA
jgi:hypothetical protein